MESPTLNTDKKDFASCTPTVVEGLNEEKKWSNDAERQVAAVHPEADTQKEIEMSSGKRFATVFLVCLAQFFDIFASASTIIATPDVSRFSNS